MSQSFDFEKALKAPCVRIVVASVFQINKTGGGKFVTSETLL